ncbi:MAG: hypothetical protein RLZZ301_1320, partial [Bacteroidota bacterium]
VPNGLSFAEAKEILSHFSADPRLCAIELVEVNPCLDEQKNKMAETALELIETIVTSFS